MEEIDAGTLATIAVFHEITTRVIQPARAKGPEYLMQAVSDFMKRQSLLCKHKDTNNAGSGEKEQQ